MALAHPAGDQLRVLRAEIDHEDGVKATGTLTAFHRGPLSPWAVFTAGRLTAASESNRT